MNSRARAESPLAGVQVVELSVGHAAALAGHYILGYGASVTQVPYGKQVLLDEPTASYVHRSKTRGSVEDLTELLESADLVISDARPAILRQLGIDWAALTERRSELIVVSVTPFGLTGPYSEFAATNATSFAMGGVMSLTGDSDRGPLVTGGSVSDATTGLNAFAAAVTGWFGRVCHGVGELYDLSAQECAAGMLEYYGAQSSYTGESVPQLGNHTRATWAMYPCLDGWAGVFALARQVPALFALMGDPELESPRFTDPLLRSEPDNEEELTAKLYVYFADKTMAQLRELGFHARVPIGIVATPEQIAVEPGLHSRGAFDEGPTGPVPGRPFPGLNWSIEDRAAVGSRGDIAPIRAGARVLPLQGIRVLDLTMMWAGPFATMRLAELGADVIKVESPTAWDNIRTLLPQPGIEDPWNSAFYFNAYNRAKRSLTLDLASDEGRSLFLRLVDTADVVIENYRADVLDKLHISVSTLAERNPRLCVVSMAAFGKEGPDRDFVGFGPVIEMLSGLVSLSGYGDGEPFKTGISCCDPIAGTAAVAAVSLALAQRNRTGTGAWVDLAQREVAMTLIGEYFSGKPPSPRGCRSDTLAPQNAYETNEPGKRVVVSIVGDDQWQTLCAQSNSPELHAMAHFDLVQRQHETEAIDNAISQWSRQHSPQQLFEILQSVGVAAGRVLTTLDVLEDPHLNHRNYWQNLPHPKMHSYRQAAPMWRLSDPTMSPRRHSPLFGEHNDEILQGELGLSRHDLERLADANIIAAAPVNARVG